MGARSTVALIVVDVINDFEHEDGERLLASFRTRVDGLRATLAAARDAGAPIVYANDNHGVWDGEASALVGHAIRRGRAGDLVRAIAPRPGDRFVVKPRYSAFDQTPLELVLGTLGAQEIAVVGTATELCVTQTAIAGQQLGFRVAVVPEACACIQEEDEAVALRYLALLGVELTGPGEAFAQASDGYDHEDAAPKGLEVEA